MSERGVFQWIFVKLGLVTAVLPNVFRTWSEAWPSIFRRNSLSPLWSEGDLEVCHSGSPCLMLLQKFYANQKAAIQQFTSSWFQTIFAGFLSDIVRKSRKFPSIMCFISQKASFENQSIFPGWGTDPPDSPIVIYLLPNEWTLAAPYRRKVPASSPNV